MTNSDDSDDDIYGGRSSKAVARRLALTREVLGMRQFEFAEKANIKRSMYNHIESGNSMPSVKIAHALCDTYSLTFDWIYCGDPSSIKYELANAIAHIHNTRRKLMSSD